MAFIKILTLQVREMMSASVTNNKRAEKTHYGVPLSYMSFIYLFCSIFFLYIYIYIYIYIIHIFSIYFIVVFNLIAISILFSARKVLKLEMTCFILCQNVRAYQIHLFGIAIQHYLCTVSIKCYRYFFFYKNVKKRIKYYGKVYDIPHDIITDLLSNLPKSNVFIFREI